MSRLRLFIHFCLCICIFIYLCLCLCLHLRRRSLLLLLLCSRFLHICRWRKGRSRGGREDIGGGGGRGEGGVFNTLRICHLTTGVILCPPILIVRGGRMVFRLERMTTTEPASGRTAGGKEGGEGPEKTPMLRTFKSIPMVRGSLSPLPLP